MSLSDEHGAWLNTTMCTGIVVFLEICGKSLLELGGDSPTHHADTVHTVDEGLHFGLKDVPPPEFNVHPVPPVANSTSPGKPRPLAYD